MKKLNEGSKYWLQLFRQMCSQASIDEWDGIDFYDIAKAAQNGDKSAKEAIFWQMRNIIEATYAKNKKSVYLWSNQLGLFEKNPEGPSQVNEMALNWISTSWTVIFDGYPISDGETVGPLIKHVQPTKGLDYLSWIYSKKILNLLYKEYYLNSSTGLSKNKGIDSISANLYADKRQDNGGEHSIKREIIDDWQSETNLPEEDLAVSDALRSFRKFTRDPELNEKKHGFSPMIAFRTVIMNMAKGTDAEKNVANLAAKYNVSRNTFASYAKEAATTLVNKYDVSLDELQQLIKVYGSGALGRLIKESSYKPKPLTRINENYDFRLLESIFNGKVLLSESDESIYDAHDEYIKDVEQKKKEDDNQENFKFDEGSVKLTTVEEMAQRKYWNNFFNKITESVDSDRIETLLKNYFDTDDVSLSDETCWGLPVYIVDNKRYAVGDSDDVYDAAVQQAIDVFEDDTDEGKIRWLQANNWPGVDEESVCNDLGDNPDDYEEESIYKPSSIDEYIDTMGYTDAAEAFSMAFIGNYLDKRELGEYIVDSDGVEPLASEDGREISIGDDLSAFCLGGAY